jgi:hypothetical protein
MPLRQRIVFNFHKKGSGHHLAAMPEPDQETSKDKPR